ncbi:NAD(P)-dependent oxidoreductase [Polynucleobacter sp.]|uniref:NAD-dependent epimerase/dehydratase family protein n=1 Tax=Polynucleobacter sp. TaxID=2029855 RepID=UPI002734EDC5|nr:NAD(P)-dependent oxidoreductase [Polynucleobacter sp.]MDP3122716.1 NAD(P)-dependent oxidoreductase [Polynucleobacter sp.]
MKLFLTGGTGFFGKSILHYLQSRHLACNQETAFEVVIMSRDPQLFIQRHPEFSICTWLRLHRGNIQDPQSFPLGEEFTDVLHAAADSLDIPELTPLNRFDQIVNGTRNVLDFAVRVHAQRFLLTSSGGVYGPQPGDMPSISEVYLGMPDPLNINNVYGVAKRQAELLCAIYAGQFNLQVKIARCFAFVGPDLPLSAHFAIGNFIKNALYDKEIIVSGDGIPLRTYLYQEDLARWLLEILQKGQSGQAYNVGSHETISLGDLAKLVGSILAPSKPVIIKGTPKGLDRNRYIPDVRKASEALGLEPAYSLRQSIELTGEILRERSGPA